MAIQDGKYLAFNTTTGDPEVKTALDTPDGNGGNLIKTDADDKINESYMPIGIGAEIEIMPSLDALTGSIFVNIYFDDTVRKCRKASAADTGKKVWGWVLESVDAAANASVRFDEIVTGLTNLEIGKDYYLSDTVPGTIVVDSPITTDHYSQKIGSAVSETKLLFNPGNSYKL